MRTTWLSTIALTTLIWAAGTPMVRGPAKPPPPSGPPALQVGPGQAYATPCAAIAAAQTGGQEIDIAPGTYTDSCEINTAGLTLRGVGGKPKIDLSGTNHPADYKGIYVISADYVTIANLELTGAHIDDSQGGNAAALRVTGQDFVVQQCYIHDNQNGVLAAPSVNGGTITIENTELAHNGLGDACDKGGCVHNVYVSDTSSAVRYDQTIFKFNWSHDLASDTPNKGHLLKSRSRETDVLYNRITGEAGHDSYEVDLPNGGLGFVIGNVIEKGTNPDNSVLVAYGEEGIDNTSSTLYVLGNTFVNDFTGGTFLQVATGATLAAHNNIFVGPGTPSSTGTLSADNMTGTDPMFVDRANYDYHLQAGSPAIGKAAALGVVGTMGLTPVWEYVQPLLSAVRRTARDLGAFEYQTATSADAGGQGFDAGGDDGGAGSPPDAGSAADSSDAPHGAAGATAGGAGTASGCGCKEAGQARDETAGVAALALAAIVAMHRRRRRPRRPA